MLFRQSENSSEHAPALVSVWQRTLVGCEEGHLISSLTSSLTHVIHVALGKLRQFSFEINVDRDIQVALKHNIQYSN